MATLDDFEDIGKIIRESFPDGCSECGSKRFKVEIEPEEKMEWMGRGLIQTGEIAIILTCQECGHIERKVIP